MRLSHRRWVWIGALGALLMATVPAVEGRAESDRFVRVKVDTANVRLGPGTKHELLWQVEENFPLKVIGRNQKWLKTEDFLGDEGWIYAPLTDERPAVVVEVDLANVRSGPGTRHPVKFQAEWGAGLLVLGRTGKWLKIEHADGDQGWIHENLVWGRGK